MGPPAQLPGPVHRLPPAPSPRRQPSPPAHPRPRHHPALILLRGTRRTVKRSAWTQSTAAWTYAPVPCLCPSLAQPGVNALSFPFPFPFPFPFSLSFSLSFPFSLSFSFSFPLTLILALTLYWWQLRHW